MNSTSLEDIAKVYSSINNGKTVAASLYRENYGETLIIIYGYTSGGDLLAADLQTLSPLGILSVNEKCGRILNADGIVELKQWFTFGCAGYKTSNRSNIVFLFDDNVIYNGTPFVPADSEQTENEEIAGSDDTAKPETTVTTPIPEESAVETETTDVIVQTETSSGADTTSPPEDTATASFEGSDTTEDHSSEPESSKETEIPPGTTDTETTTEYTEQGTTSAPFDFTNF